MSAHRNNVILLNDYRVTPEAAARAAERQNLQTAIEALEAAMVAVFRLERTDAESALLSAIAQHVCHLADRKKALR